MAIKDFTDAIKSKAYRNWFSALDPNVIKLGSSALRERFENDPTKNNFLITDQKIKDMAAYATNGRTITAQEVAAIKQRMYDSLKRAKNNGVAYNVVNYGVRDPSKGEEIVIENVNFQTIETILKSGFGNKLTGSERNVGSGYHRGHIYGLPTVLLNASIAEIENLEIPDSEVDGIVGRGKQLKNNLIEILKAYQTELKNQDIATSNMGSAGVDYDIYANYTKDPDSFLIEMQVGAVNSTSGSAAGRTFGELKQFLNPEKINAGIIKNAIADLVKPSVILNFLNSPGSPPWVQLLGNKIANTMDPINKNRDVKAYSIPSTPVATNSIKLKRSQQDKQRSKNEIAKVSKLIKELQQQDTKLKQVRRLTSTTSLASLQTLLNLALAQQIQRNMGTGTRRDVLNYRTGRFAESAQVTSLSQSREGMITAFYTYMRNPYGTFSEGGAQGSPKTRDPKLLISKSIREIMSTQVNNRLRAVLA